MGIERARVVEVHARTSATGRVGSGYLVSDRLVLTCRAIVGRQGSTDVRPAGTAPWVSASLVWADHAGQGAVLEVDDPSALMVSPDPPRWGEVGGTQAVPVMAMGFPASPGRPEWARDPEQFFGHLVPPRSGAAGQRWAVRASGRLRSGDGVSGAALFAGAELVGVLVAGSGPDAVANMSAVTTTALAADEAFVRLVGDARGLALTPVRAASFGFPILPSP